MISDDCYGRTVKVVYEDHEAESISEAIGVFDGVHRLGEPEIFYVGIVTSADPITRRYIPSDDVLGVEIEGEPTTAD